MMRSFIKVSFLLLILSCCVNSNPRTFRIAYKEFIKTLTEGDVEKLKRISTKKGIQSLIRGGNNADTISVMKHYGEIFKSLETKIEIRNELKIKVWLGENSPITGRSALIFIKENKKWKFKKFLPGK